MSRTFRRDIFTGELVEDTESDIEAEFEVVNARSRKKVENMVPGRRKHVDPYSGGKDFLSKSMSIAPEQATKSRINKENADAKHHNTGAYYTPDGGCYLPTRGVRAREMSRRHKQDNDACFSDCPGR